ncbi:hypothetical protein GGI25_003546 [Coemansia spiralis]|uniref:Uncharacterized protein n=2 Tax=Coemansia TaxID=4863 RepID=A0A9W8G7Z0_9FUNG|nr:hypothetical protein BX070DRAFT_19532 [Coemansia spiralis]KAJ1990436.1 hypothetical protein EDC05_004080 [Coemansia umbellata]KAJ2622077.1 hypothetical protein GGI26_003519 [Coemansia sp. RSA 1358]KAJ2676511.1 hypothetical protein GGI25_003546 [Coemansia spiralis]
MKNSELSPTLTQYSPSSPDHRKPASLGPSGIDSSRSTSFLSKRRNRCVLLLSIVAIVVAAQTITTLLNCAPPGPEHTNGLLSLFTKPGPRLCADLPVSPDHWLLTNANAQAFVDIPHLAPLHPGDTVCVRVILPARKPNVTMIYAPFPNAPWDSVLLDMVGSTGVSVPVDLSPVARIESTIKDSVHIYEADVVLRDVGKYRPQGFIEFRDAQWNPEGRLLPATYKPEPLLISDVLEVEVVDSAESPFSLARYMDLPLCAESSPEGRWVSIGDLPFDASTMPSDNHNKVWLPYNCRLQYITYKEFAQCLVQKYPSVHLFGDSNIRRAMKKITTLGKWCSTQDERNTTGCVCEDYREPFDRFDVGKREVLVNIDPINGGMEASNNATRKSVIRMRKWEGLIEGSNEPWWKAFEPSGRPDPQIAVISLTNWDAAFSTRAFFAQELSRLLNLVDTTYSNATEIIVRTGQYYCCRSDDSSWKRRYSRLRNKLFDKYIIEAFKERFGGARKLSIWDVASLMEHQPFAARNESVVCNSNHVRSEIVDIENQLLFNYMCN